MIEIKNIKKAKLFWDKTTTEFQEKQ